MGQWITDAEHLGDLTEKNIYKNTAMNSFLDNGRIFCLIASKGMGKTLLLRLKRQRISDYNNPGLILPTNKPLDMVKWSVDLNDYFSLSFKEPIFWQQIWELSILVSILLNYPIDKFNEDDLLILNLRIDELDLPDSIKHGLANKIKNKPFIKLNPSEILANLLSLGVGALDKIRNSSIRSIYNLIPDVIRRSISVFIDSFDQALLDIRPFDLNIWMAGQHGLLLASWNISRYNPHIKIYTSIRQEAYSTFVSPDSQAMRGSILVLKYSKKELKQIMDVSVKNYEGFDNIESYLKINTILNQFVRKKEHVFDYIYRHSIGTPRSLMVIGDEFSKGLSDYTNSDERADEIRNIVNAAMSDEIVYKYLVAEMIYFLTCLSHEIIIQELMKLISMNILNYDDMTYTCKKFNKQCKADCINCKKLHPFCELYNIGLLGVIDDDATANVKIQKFKKPYEFNKTMSGILPNSLYYLIHPSLQNIVKKQNPNYNINDQILIGDAYPWNADFSDLVENEKIKIFISYSSKDSKLVEKICTDIKYRLLELGRPSDIWLDKWKLRGGQWYQQEIKAGIINCDVLLLVVTNNSLTSKWVESEWSSKYSEEEKHNIKIIPLLVDIIDSDLPLLLQTKHCLQMVKNDKKNYASNIIKISDDMVKYHTQSRMLLC
jgi:hypothetical protein